MFPGIDNSTIDGALEALLFVTDEPVNVITLASMLEADTADVQDALTRIQARLECEDAGIQLQEVAGGWRLTTNPRYHELLEKYVLSWDTRRLTQAAIETLAIIAYGQPITRLGIATIRGVNSDSSVNSLIDKGLVRESGPADAPGYPMTYSTTKAFLEKFGLNSVADLPPIEEFAPDDEVARMVAEGLSSNAYAAHLDDANASDAAAGQESIMFDDASDALGAVVADALAESAGIVQKINFDEIDFEE